ncbi:MAG: undecaprenyl-diphosphate phosphatase [Clostridiales bacterium]|nr:undecaprenyl-diphosphate phosphatase [Clostridiales bacterium]
MDILEIFKVVFLGIVEGITEWLPISSTGHIILVDEFLKMNQSESFMKMFEYVIQLGAIMAVVVLYFKKLWPFSTKEKYFCKKDTWTLWFKIFVAIIPGTVAYFLFDDFVDAHFRTPYVIASTLIIYGIIFIVIEKLHKGKSYKVTNVNDITYQMAFMIGLFQVLSIVPGTSRSGATIIGAMLIGASRIAATEFTFYLAVPVMVGMSALKILKFGLNFTTNELLALVLGMLTAFVVSIIAIKFLLNYLKRNTFIAFGWYRIVLGCIVLGYFLVAR